MINISQDIKIFLTFFLIFSFFTQWVSWNEFSRFALTRAISEENVLNIDSFYNQTGDRSYYEGHYYTDKAPGMSFTALPIYTLWKLVYHLGLPQLASQVNLDGIGLTYYVKEVAFTYYQNPSNFLLGSMFLVTVFTSSLFSALTVLLLYKVSKYFTDNEKERLLIVLIYGLGTLAFSHALVFTSHSAETFFGFLSFYLLLKFKQNKLRRGSLFLAGIFLGFGLVVGYSSLLIGAVCLLYLFSINKKAIVIFLTGFALAILPLIIYSYSIFGTPFDFTGRLKYLDTIPIPANLEKFYIGQDSGVSSGLLNFLRLTPLLIPILSQMLIFPSKGLFFYHPILIFSFIGLVYAYKKYKIESMLIVFLFTLFLVIIPFQFLIWWGAFSGVGLRYMLPVVPFLMIPLISALKKIDLKILILPLCFSIFVNFLLLQYGEDTISMMNPSQYEEKLKNFQVLSDPLINHYLPLFLRNGPRSILFENILLNKKIDIRLTPHSCGLTPPILQKSEVLLFTLPFIGIIALKLPFLSLVPIFLVIFLIWKKEILKKLNLSSKQKLLILIGSIFIFIVLFIRITNFLYGENWYAPEWHNGKLDTGKWAYQNSTIQIFNKYQKEIEKTFAFNIEPFYELRTLQIYSNDKLVFEDIIKNETRIKKQLNLTPGLNVIKFYSVEGCDIPTELGVRDCDLRCLSFKIYNVQIISNDK